MSAVYLLLGFPGTGKYTVGKALTAEIERRGGTARLVDNHYVNNVVFGVIDKPSPLPQGVWDHIREVRRAVVGALHDYGDPAWSVVFTNFITEAEIPGIDPEFFPRIKALGDRRAGGVRVVRLSCETEELARRVVRDDRRQRMKLTNVDRLRALVAENTIHHPQDLPTITLDVTHTSPDETANRILDAAWS
jgi:hypothetical protein